MSNLTYADIRGALACACARCKKRAADKLMITEQDPTLAFNIAFEKVHMSGTIPGLTVGDVSDL